MTALPPLPRDRVLQLIGRMKGSRVVVVGDIMIDRYLVGETERLSPEAPVPVVTIRERHSALGGAANVAANVSAMGATCLLVGVVGDDTDGAAIRQNLAIARLVAALRDFPVLGVRTNIPFLLRVLDHADFRAGRVDTGFLDRADPPLFARPAELPAHVAAVMAARVNERLGPAARAGIDPWDA